jgi:hypothetical protein
MRTAHRDPSLTQINAFSLKKGEHVSIGAAMSDTNAAGWYSWQEVEVLLKGPLNCQNSFLILLGIRASRQPVSLIASFSPPTILPSNHFIGARTY